MGQDQRNVVVDRRALIEVVRELNTLVVSLDRLGAASAGMSARGREKALARFAQDWDLFGRLSKARRTLTDELTSDAASEDEAQGLEKELDDTPYWTPNVATDAE